MFWQTALLTTILLATLFGVAIALLAFCRVYIVDDQKLYGILIALAGCVWFVLGISVLVSLSDTGRCY